MKNHKKKTVTVHIPWDHQPLGDFLNGIFDASSGMVDCTIRQGYDNELEVVGWVPMTEKEIERAAARRKASAAKAEARERAEYERLKEKYDRG